MQKKSGPPKPESPIYIHRGSGEYLENVTLLFISTFSFFIHENKKIFSSTVLIHVCGRPDK